ncbi:NADH-quinone oxidoreductase subunit E [Marivita sp. XM-24bin2]|uniref:NADH-quinone oxidoreductase subunit E n=1 Tax=Marivita sp. XM-24bin2 TaxID=2133951 RepID=UPI000D79166C|nr:NADH-quinone oxidoreductase subunit E [Marivita sp. XM-24bin2]MCR9107605.1 NADH-quinone oxidoreductase subunit E [Paracoccaceae bacterium]PWL34868.1 MAG: fused NADH-quinone oxidoreductase subunit E/endonuclease [Marivita sp. XM-24bin2]
MLRRLHSEQPESFAFTADNQAWAEAQITKYPEGRQASAIIPLLWRAQEQEGWLTRPAIEAVADMLGMAYMRALEVASFYFMFQLQPVGSVAHIQICGTTSCMICGAEDLVAVCKEKIASKPHTLSADGKLSWEEVECLGACANAPMAQIGKDYYEDLTAERFGEILDELAAGGVPTPGPQNGRYAAEPKSGLTSLNEYESGRHQYNASVQLAMDIGDTVKRIDGTEVPLIAPWQGKAANESSAPKPGPDAMMPPAGPDGAQGGRAKGETPAPRDVGEASDKRSEAPGEAPDVAAKAKPPVDSSGATEGTASSSGSEAAPGLKPATLDAPKDGKGDDLKRIKGIGPKLAALCNRLGFYHFDQIASWTDEEVAWVDENLEGFKGRVSRDNWVEQAKTLASGGETEFSARVNKGDVNDG